MVGLEDAEGFTDSQWILFAVAIVFNTIVLMNILLAVVGKAFGEVDALNRAYYYKQLSKQICMLQRICFLLKNKPDQGLQLFTRVRREVS